MNGRRSLLIWLLWCAVAGGVFLAYALTSLAAGRGAFVLPLDDVYIHFQYAKQLAHGQSYIYNPGQPPTSGATSLLYPFVLALGYLLGFQGLNLSLWAMLIGALALLGSLRLVYCLLWAYDAPEGLAVGVTLIFGLTGAVSWHFMSGMETGLMILFTLATLYGVVAKRLGWLVVSAALLALTRPEGGILAGIAVIALGISLRQTLSRRQILLLLIPIQAIFVQPLVNLLVTGSAVATGNSVKSIFGTVPFYWDEVLRRIVENFARMGAEFVTGISPREGMYLPYLVGALALAFLIGGLFSRRYRLVNALLILWLLAGMAAIATLDTAFWHFKRYQMPLLALLFPAAGWGINWFWGRMIGARQVVPLRIAMYGLVGAGLVVALTTGAVFLQHFALNVDYVYLQPLQMARWLQANTPEDAVIAVHDVGMMRYMGERTTLDMVGLTTPGAAAYWRNGPGSIAEFLIQERPDYIAAYGKGHGYGLELIANTRIYGDPLAEFPVILDPNFNVALAADYQGIYQPNWREVGLDFDDFEPWTGINVANLDSEAAFQYAWENHERVAVFPTDIQELRIPGCSAGSCTVADGMRRINGAESFVLSVQAKQSVNLLTVVHPASNGTLDVYANDQLVRRRWIPEMPGWIVLIPTQIPADMVTSDRLQIRIEPHIRGDYMPLWHLILQSDLEVKPIPSSSLVTYQEGAILLTDFSQVLSDDQLYLNLQWYSNGNPEGDYRFFAHLYADPNEPPVAQTDRYPLIPPSPPGNWLPGPNWDQVMVDLSDVPPGTYQLAIGFYNPYTGERLLPESDVYDVTPDGRLWLGAVTVSADSDS